MLGCSGMSETNNKTELYLAPSPTNQRHRVLEADQSRGQVPGHNIWAQSSVQQRRATTHRRLFWANSGVARSTWQCLPYWVIQLTFAGIKTQQTVVAPNWFLKRMHRGKWGQQGRIAVERTHTPHTRHRHTEISENNDFWQTRAGPWCSTPQLAATRRFMCRVEPPSILFVLDGTLGGSHSVELLNFGINAAMMNTQKFVEGH